ncbi:MAG TPA: HU family DNA-binding protein [Ignavibacteriales bacterium]|nr:HU family DNA-binding protein [Ignavibacteriales bacterium]
MKNKLSFADLISYIAKETGSSKTLVQLFIKEMANVIEEGLIRDGVVHIAGLGIFKLQTAKETRRKIPNTNDYKIIPAHYRVGFKPEKSLREYLNERYAHLKTELLEENPAPAIPALAAASIPNAVLYNRIAAENPPEPRQSLKKTYLFIAAAIILFFGGYAIYENSSLSWSESNAISATVAAETKEAKIENLEQSIKTCVVSAGDNLWSISNTFYARPYLWPNIYRANQKVIEDPDFLQIGTVLNIPSLSGKNGELSVQDKADLAEGYIQAYLTYKKLGRESARYYLWAAKRFDAAIVNNYKDQIETLDLIEDEPVNTASAISYFTRF